MPSTHEKKRHPSYRYVIRNEHTLTEYLNNHNPLCYSCEDDTALIRHWSFIDEATGIERFVCIDCLDCYTEIPLGNDFDVYTADWTSRKNLQRLRAYHCASDGELFVTAMPGQRFRFDCLDPELEHLYR